MSGDDLDGAYSLRTPEDNARYYDAWAARYDAEFADSHGYVYPQAVARAFAAAAGPQDAPVLDIGAGTGLVGLALRAAGVAAPVDGLDISPGMLALAAAKGACRATIEADLTAALPIADAVYGGLVSSGTFTHGHVGPVCLPELLRVARPGALWVLGIHAGVFDTAGFGSAFASLVAEGCITPVDFRRVAIYAGAAHDHAEDRALVAVFRSRS